MARTVTISARDLAATVCLALAACTSAEIRPLPGGVRHTRPAVDLRLGDTGHVVEQAPSAGLADPADPVWTLGRCVRQALEANRGLLDADSQVEAADYSFIAAESEFQVRVLPSVLSTVNDDGSDATSANVSIQQLSRNGTLVEFVPSITRSNQAYESGYRASLTQPLLRGRQRDFVESSVNRARYGQRSAARSRYLVEVDVVLATIQAVYRVIQERESMRLIEESAVRAEANLAAAGARERAGLSTSLDVFRASQQRNRVRDARNTAVRAFQDAMDSLRILLALPLNTEMRVDAPLDVAKDGVTLEQAVAIALERRVELRQAEDDVSEARRLTRVAEINTQIDVDVVLSLGQTGASGAFADSFELGSPQLGISLASNSDVRRIAEKAAYEQARIRATITNRSYRLRQDLVIQDVKRGLRRVELGRRSIEVQRAQITQAQGKLIVARKKFELGLATNYNVVEAEDDLRTAETELIRAVASTVDSQYSLRAAIGTLVEIPEELQ